MFEPLGLAYDIVQARVGQESKNMIPLACAAIGQMRSYRYFTRERSPDRDDYTTSLRQIRLNHVACQPWVFCCLV